MQCRLFHLHTASSERLSINQSINVYRAIVQRRVLQCGYAESKRNVLRRILNVLTDEAVRQFSGRQFQSLGAATEKRRAAVSKLCGGTDRNFCVDECVEVWMTSCMYSETLRLGCMLLYHMTVLHNSIHTFARKQCLKCKFWAQKLYVV